jgi:hypothetical protein
MCAITIFVIDCADGANFQVVAEYSLHTNGSKEVLCSSQPSEQGSRTIRLWIRIFIRLDCCMYGCFGQLAWSEVEQPVRCTVPVREEEWLILHSNQSFPGVQFLKSIKKGAGEGSHILYVER